MIKVSTLIQLVTNRSGASQGGPHIAGWSEQWYNDGAIAQVQQATFALNLTRALLLPLGATIVGQRYQVIGGGSATSSTRFPGAAGAACDIPQMALLCKAAGSGVPNIRRFTLRGLPDSVVSEGEYLPDFFFEAAWAQFRNRLVNDGWRFRGRNLAAPTVKVAHIEAGVFTLQADLAFVLGDYLQLRNVYNQSGKNVSGIFQVIAKTSAQSGTLRGFPSTSIVDLRGEASVYSIIYPTLAAGAVEPVRTVSRKVGRPFEQYRGRTTSRR